MKGICVFLSSSRDVDQKYIDVAIELGKKLVENEFELIWGGADIGSMGEIARAVQQEGGIARGVLPKSLLKIGLDYREADELIVTKNMSMRKKVMDDLSYGYIALPGGFGTLEELFEVITLKQLGYHTKPIVLLNPDGFYDHLITFINESVLRKFIKADYDKLFHVCTTTHEAVSYIQNYEYKPHNTKW